MNSLLTNCVCTVFSQDIHVITDNEHTDSFLITVNHDGIENDILARVYSYRDNWYIWYTKSYRRRQVQSFTEALLILEEEILKCVA